MLADGNLGRKFGGDNLFKSLAIELKIDNEIENEFKIINIYSNKKSENLLVRINYC